MGRHRVSQTSRERKIERQRKRKRERERVRERERIGILQWKDLNRRERKEVGTVIREEIKRN